MAKILFTKVSNSGKLASCHVNLGEFSLAVEAARRANNPKVWKEVTFACVSAGEFKAAATVGLSILQHPDHLEDLIKHYDSLNCVDELIALLEAGVAQDRAHPGLYTELGVLYAKHRPEKLMEFVKQHTSSGSISRMNVPKLIRLGRLHSFLL